MKSSSLRSLLLLLAALLLGSPMLRAEDGFTSLFNGKDLSGWHLRYPEKTGYWKVEDGILKNELPAGQHGVDLVSDKKYWNFIVRYEYQVPDGSNSGFYLRGRHEIQILGDFKSGKPSMGGNGAIYQHTAPSVFASKPAGEWQQVEATMIGDKITVVLNGKKIHDQVPCDRATGSELDKNVLEPGSFFLQGDHGVVSFRKIEVKELPKE
jgi:3-keto-disaccharide hydrolase